MPKTLLLIQPTVYRSREDRTPVRIRRRKLAPLTLPYLAALVPPDWTVTLADEMLGDIDFSASPDLVAITTWTMNSRRAYDVAARFRDRNIPVIMGGPHVFFHAEEAAAHADAVAVGEGETLIPRMLEDAAAGRLEPVYRAPTLEDLGGLPHPRYDLLDLKRYGLVKTFAVQPSRGCPFKCGFCAERVYLGEGFRFRPVPEVLEEVRRLKSRYVFFAASNFAGSRDAALALMEGLVPLKVRWSTLWTMHLCKDREFMDLAQKSGLLHVNIGMESIDPQTLRSMNKTHNRASEYREILAGLRARGVSYSLNLIFGWDTEDPGVFRSTLDFLREQRVPAAYFNVLTPEKGSEFYERMVAQGRVRDLADVGRWPDLRCHLDPVSCSPEELVEKVRGMYREFYSLRSMLARLPVLPRSQADMASWAINLSQRRMAAEGENFTDF